MSIKLDVLPWEDILDLADTLLERGVSEEETINQIAEILDQIVDFSIIFPTPAGKALEAVDHTIFAAALKIAVTFSLKTPDQRKARRDKLGKKLANFSLLKKVNANKR